MKILSLLSLMLSTSICLAQSPVKTLTASEVHNAKSIADLGYKTLDNYEVVSISLVYVEPDRDPVLMVNHGPTLTETTVDFLRQTKDRRHTLPGISEDPPRRPAGQARQRC